MAGQIIRRGTDHHRAIPQAPGAQLTVGQMTDPNNQIPAVFQQVLALIAKPQLHLDQRIMTGKTGNQRRNEAQPE